MVDPKTLSSFGPAAWLVLIDGALGRGDLDKLYRKNAPKSAPQPARLGRHQVVGAVVGHALKAVENGDDEGLRTLCRLADKRSQTESRLLQQLDEEAAADKLRTYGGMQFKRQRSRMIWAALGDRREAVTQAALDMLGRVLEAAQKGDSQVSVPGPKVTGAGRKLPGLGANIDSAKLGKLRRALDAKDHEIGMLRQSLSQAQNQQARARGDQRREIESHALDEDAASALQAETKTLRETCRELEQKAAEAQRAEAALQGELETMRQAQQRAVADQQSNLDELHQTLKDERQAWQLERKALLRRADQDDDSPQGVVLLFDAANLGAGARAAGGHLDFPSLSRRLLDGRPLRFALAFAVAEPGPERERFESALRQAGIDLRWKQTQVFADGSTKADWDVGIAVEAMRWAGRAQTLIVVSGDGDFLPLIDALKSRGTTLEAAGWPGRTHAAWSQAVARFTELDAQDLIKV